MKKYCLTDIHFHTNDSFDAYENRGYENYDPNKIAQIMTKKETGILKLLCKTDHNILNYSKFQTEKTIFSEYEINLLPGIEVNGNEKIHWLFIFSDEELSKESKGQLLENDLYSKVFKYNDSEKLLKQAEEIQSRPVDIDDLLTVFHNLKLSYLAIPHLNKSGGCYNKFKKDDRLFQEINHFLNDSVISGFESKQQKKFIKDNIEETQRRIKEIYDKISSETQEDKIKEKNEEVLRRLKHYNKMSILETKLNANGVSIIYGSDFHGKDKLSNYENCKSNLFYIHSEPTFEGLKLSLLDQESRIFSIEEQLKYQKNSNYVISHIDFEINDKLHSVQFGDNLNSIIGSRGSGKSFIIKSILGKTLTYKDNKIIEDIKLKKIHMLDGDEYDTLPEHMYDILSQQSSGNKENKNLYNLLSEAPYDMLKFEKEIDKLNFEKTINDDIYVFFKSLNDQITVYKSLQVDKASKIDFGFISEYNNHFLHINEAQKTFQLFSNFTAQSSSLLSTYELQKKEIEDTVINLKTNLDKINVISEYKLTKKNEIKFNIDKIGIQKTIEKLEVLAKIYVNSIEKLKTAYKHSGNILKTLSTLNDNKTNILTKKIGEIDDLLKRYIEKIQSLKQSSSKLSIMNKLICRETIYKYNSGNTDYIVKVIKEIDTSDIPQNVFLQIFNKYREFPFKESILTELVTYEGLEKNSVNLMNTDQRFSANDLIVPQIEPRIELFSGSETVDWALLSPGERSTYLLNIVLDSDSNKILFIDQPEDDLDNETVYKTIVQRLRVLKKKRQIIVVTHNANIVLNGDSDAVVVSYNDNGKFSIIDSFMESTKKFNYPPHKNDYRIMDLSAEILEGGREALRMRIKKMGSTNIFFKEERT